MKKTYKIKHIIISFMVVFVIAVLGFIYIFQLNYLDDFYKASKISEMRAVETEIYNGLINDNLVEAAENASLSNEVCVRVISRNTAITGYRTDGSACALKYLNTNQISQIYNETLQNGSQMLFENYVLKRDNTRIEDLYITARIVDDGDFVSMILVSSIVAPLNPTIATIRNQLVVVSVIVIIATLILGYFIGRFVVKPFNLMIAEAKHLPDGNYCGKNVKTLISECQELNQTLIDSCDKINEAERTRKELLSNVSHDLRTPLTMIAGYGEMMIDFDEEKNDENLKVIIDEAKRLSSLVDDLLDLSKAELGRLKLNKSSIALNDLMQNVYNQYSRYLNLQHCQFVLDLDEDVIIEADEKRLKQVLYNFINNAINYNDKDEPVITLYSKIDDDQVEFGVIDNGEGIKAEDLDRVWDRYYKVDREHKRQLLGSGIGLSLAKKIIDAHGFICGAESEYGASSKFYVRAAFAQKTQGE